MSEKILLVDYENVPKLSLEEIPPDVKVPFFFGASQRTVTREFFKSALKLGDRFIPVDIEGFGKNALDFHIAFYLGEYLAQAPTTECVILSRDKGFDPLIRHLTARGFSVRRVGTVAEAFPLAIQASEPDPRVARVLQLLGKLAKNNRPRTRKTLLAQVTSFFPKLPREEAEAIVSQLQSEGKFTQDGNRLTYHF